MRTITEIIRVEERQSTHKKNKYFRTYAICGGDEVVGYSDEADTYKVGMSVECFFDSAWNTAKMQLPKKKGNP